ncbi:hypothetical protein Pcinc_042413 [Petrolisthes cinctipes]|uniref:Uncharacterized protein n=1 Tax=Petrolisthes cinctipes TaxID=88211 RepID=A0AAE1EG08_PETCI|nr:hypothetical protein Pcinc_042413 [Petrolisthes cinctipes]
MAVCMRRESQSAGKRREKDGERAKEGKTSTRRKESVQDHEGNKEGRRDNVRGRDINKRKRLGRGDNEGGRDNTTKEIRRGGEILREEGTSTLRELRKGGGIYRGRERHQQEEEIREGR